MLSFLSRFKRNQHGAAAIEMAFALPIFTSFLLGIIGFSHAVWVRNSMEAAQDRAGRFAMMNPTATEEEIAEVITDNMFGVFSDDIVEVDVVDNTVSGVTYRTIDVTYTYSFLTAFNDFMPNTITSESTVPVIP